MMKYKRIILESGCEIAIVINNIESINLFEDNKKVNIQMKSGKTYVAPNKSRWSLGDWCYYFEIYS